MQWRKYFFWRKTQGWLSVTVCGKQILPFIFRAFIFKISCDICLCMTHSRRHFIRQTSAALLAGVSISDLAVRPTLPSAASIDNDEQYWKLVRDQFPLDKNLTYLNNGTMGPSPYPVIEAVNKGMMDTEQFLSYSGWEHAAAKIATFVGAHEHEIALTHNVTEGINIYTWGLPLRKGDEVILTTHEHVGNALPWLNRQKLHGIVIKTFSPAPTAAETLNRIDALITKKTRVIAVPHVPCTQGQVFPIKDICALGKSKGLFVVVDGAHGPGMLSLNLHDMGCDAYTSCGHKWMLGPKGTGFLYVRKDFQQTLQPFFVGSGSDNATWNMNANPVVMGAYADSAHRYYGGTQNLGLYKGLEAAIDFINQIGMDTIAKRINYLGKYTQDALLGVGDKLEILTPTEDISRCGVNGFRIKGVQFDQFYNRVAEQKIRIRMVPENGLNCLRVSTHIYNTTAEIDALVELVKKA
jgi:cysteine desulfurase / selenocysteine lyase